MLSRLRILTLASLAIPIAACAQTPGEITRDTQPFDGIAVTATITALGNEPFWGLEIMPDGDGYSAQYTTPENIDGSRFAATRFAGNNGLGFSGAIDGMAVQATITPGDCSDGMSDRTYPYTATVMVGEITLRGCAFTSDEPYIGDEVP